MRKYTHLFFDLDNTLWDFKTNSKLAMETTWQLLGIEKQGVSFEHFFASYSQNNELLWASYRKKEIRKKELTRKRFQLTFDELGLIGVDPDEMNKCYLHEMPKQKSLLPGTIPVLEELKKRGYKMYIITNGFKEVQKKKLLSSGLDAYFSKLFISEEVKMPKPGREIFEYAIKSTNARKSGSVMIGDDWDVDILGALAFGIDAVYIGKESFDMDKKDQKVEQIESLSQLLGLL